MICKFNNTHSVTGIDEESVLHKRLRKKFPQDVEDGDSIHYVDVIGSEKFKEFFGDWTNPTVYTNLKEQARDTNVFNHQGEPRLQEEFGGNGYFINTAGEKYYVRPPFTSLTPTQQSAFVNTLTAEYIQVPGESISFFIKKKLQSQANALGQALSEQHKKIESTSDSLEKMDLGDIAHGISKAQLRIQSIVDDNNLLNILTSQVTNKLSKDNFKLTEQTDDKEDTIDAYEDTKNFLLDSTEQSNRASADVEVLKFLAGVPVFQPNSFNADVSLQEPIRNPILQSPQYMNQNQVWDLLERTISNIIPNNKNTEYQSKDVFENYLRRIQNTANDSKSPELNFIASKLRGVDDNFKTKFATTFFKSKQTYLITQITKDRFGNIKFKVVDPAVVNSRQGKLANEYIETVLAQDNLSVKRLESVLRSFRDAYKPLRETQDVPKLKEVIKEKLIAPLGLKIDPKTVDYLVDVHTKVRYDNIIKLVDSFVSIPVKDGQVNEFLVDKPEGDFEVLIGLEGSTKTDKSEAFKDYLLKRARFIRSLALADSNFRTEVSESSFLVGGKQRWQYSLMSSMAIELEKWKSGDLANLERLRGKGLTFVDYLLENPDRIDLLDIATNSEIKTQFDANPVLHKNITEVDLHLDIFAKMFNSSDEFYAQTTDRKQGPDARTLKEQARLKNYIIYNFGADKNSLFSIFGLPTPNSGKPNMVDYQTGKIGTDFKGILAGYVKGELKRAQQEGFKIEKYFEEDNKKKYLMENLIPGYHYNTDKNIEQEDLTKEDFKRGSYYKIGVFTPALDAYLENNYELVYEDINAPIVKESFFTGGFFGELMDIVYQDTQKVVDDNFDYLSSIPLIRNEQENGSFQETNLFEVDTNIEFPSEEARIYSYITSSFVASYELSNMFNGHINYYKQSTNTDAKLDDFLKRAPAIATDGLYFRHRNTGTSKTYTTYGGETITIKDQDDQAIVAVVNNLDVNSKYENLISKGANTKLNYAHEIADAQGYITPKHFRDLITRVYGWSEQDQTQYGELIDPNHRYTDDNIRWIKRFSKSFTPLKLVHFEQNEQGVPIYLKYSVATLFPSMVNGSDMQVVLDKMEGQGVEQLVFKSGSKASNYAPTTIHNTSEDGTYEGINSDFKLNPFTINSYQNLKLQVQIPTKLDGSIRLGNQSIKNIMTNMDMKSTDKVYNYREEDYSAKEIYDQINDSAIRILQTQLNTVLTQLGYDRDTNKFSERLVKRLLIKQMDLESETDLRYFLNTELPLETIPNFAQRAFPVIAAYLQKNAGKLYTNGSSVVQVANAGYDRLSSKEATRVFYLSEQSELTPPLPELNSKGEVIGIKKAKILLPFTSIFQRTGMSWNEFQDLYKKGKVDKRIFNNVIGYRIPNQALSSNDSFEVVGILPPISGDQAVLYHEITAKTGSDFDIDKLYMMLPNFKVKKKFYVPEDYKVKLGIDVPHISDLLASFSFPAGTKAVGNKLLNLFAQNNERLLQLYIKALNDPKLKGKRLSVKHPITLILDNYEEAIDILQEDNTIVAEEFELMDLLKEVKTAYDSQKAMLKDKNREIFKKYKQLESIEKIDYIDNNGYRGQQNKLIELLSSIIDSPKSYNDLMSPLDNDIIKRTIDDIKYQKAVAKEEYSLDPTLSEQENKDKYLKSITASGLQQLSPKDLAKARVDVLEAKSLIAIMANNMTDLGESQKTNFRLDYPIGFKDGVKVATSLGKEYQLGKKGDAEFKISKIVSYLMNAAVDAAKDNYIIEGNFNTYTANPAILMVRLGVPVEDVFTILMNSTVINMAKDRTYAKGKMSDLSPEIPQENLDKLSKGFLKALKENDNDLFSVISRDDFIHNTSNNVQNKILGFWNLLVQVGKEMNDAVVSAKSDANGAGKNIAEFIALQNRIERVENSSIKNSFEKWFEGGLTKDNMQFNPNIQNNEKAKYLGAMANNTLFLMNELSKQTFLETTDNVKNIVKDINASLGNPLDISVANIKLVYNYLYPNLLYSTGHKMFNIDKDREIELLRTFPREVAKKKKELDNEFLNELIVETTKPQNLISFPSFRSYDTQSKAKLKEAFSRLMRDEPGLANDLVQYSFLTSGFKSTIHSFNDMIPANYFMDNMFSRSIADQLHKLNDVGYNELRAAEALTLMAKTNPNNFKIVKPLSSKADIISGLTVQDEKTLKRVTTSEKDRKRTYAPFVKVRGVKGRIYMLTNIDDTQGTKLPVYTSIRSMEDNPFKIYSFYDIDTGVLEQSVDYESKVNNLYKNFPLLNEEVFNCKIK